MSSRSDGDGERREGYEVGRGEAGRRKVITVIVGVILGIFVVLLTIWLLGRGSDSVEGARPASAGQVTLVVTDA